jgi:predicted DNA-binding protein with PD1-like motif
MRALVVLRDGFITHASCRTILSSGANMSTQATLTGDESNFPRYAVVSDHGGAKTYIIAFGKDQEVVSGLQAFVKQKRIFGANFSAVGGVRSGVLASGRPMFEHHYNEYKKIPVDQQAEVASLTGNVALVAGEPRLHVHGVLALPDGTAIAGHVVELRAWPTVEVVLVEWQKPAWRTLDEETGMQVLVP